MPVKMGSCYSQWINLLKKAVYYGLCLYSKFVCWSINLPNHSQSPPLTCQRRTFI